MGLLPFVSMSASSAGPTAGLGDRIRQAIDEEGRGRSQNALEQQAGFKSGVLSRYIKWKPPENEEEEGRSRTVDLDKLIALADLLHVRREWLLTGEGPMRREGRSQTRFEVAMVFARQAGCREDAIQLAWERLKQNEPNMTELDWAQAFHNEAMLLDRAGVKRPEKVKQEQGQIERVKRKKARALEKRAAEEEAARANVVPLPAGKRRAAGD
jgi:hypothetical protein